MRNHILTIHVHNKKYRHWERETEILSMQVCGKFIALSFRKMEGFNDHNSSNQLPLQASFAEWIYWQTRNSYPIPLNQVFGNTFMVLLEYINTRFPIVRSEAQGKNGAAQNVFNHLNSVNNLS